MQDLIAALEAGPPSPELDARIYEVRFGRSLEDDEFCEAYTTSLDAALTLVPEGWLWSAGMQNVGDYTGPLAFCWQEQPPLTPRGSRGTTPALALCIAALKARF